jgi:nucleotide-binding universal stress UspA family protein
VTSGGGFERGTDGPRIILAGTDGSDTGLRALAYAAGLARRQGSRLVVAFVTGAPPASAGWMPGGAAAAADAADQVDAELRVLVPTAAERLGISVEYRLLSGDPATELTRLADALPADAVVVGASTQAGHRVVGSVAVRLVRAGHWPVTVVP